MKKLLLTMIVVMLTMAFVSQSSAIIYPNPTLYAVQYGDGYSYSLPILAWLTDLGYFTDFGTGYEAGQGVGPGNPYYVTSTPGQISSLIVIGTGASGVPVNQNFSGMDNAYPTPSGVSGSTIFSTQFTPDPGQVGGPFTGDAPGTWDTQLGALINYLTIGTQRSNLVFYFNNNQTNSGEAINQNLFAWAQASIVDVEGVEPTLYYDFTSVGPIPHGGIPGGDPLSYNSPGAPNSNFPYLGGGIWPSFNDFVLSGGQVCLDNTTKAIVDCATCSDCTLFNHNLGANQAAYALIVPEINAGLEGWLAAGYDTMSIDWRMTALNNGYEQLFIMPGLVQQQIPEPSSIVLLGSGLLGLGLYFRRKFRK